MKTFVVKEQDIKRKWYIVDAKDKTLGRLATKVATVLRGKHKAIFTPFVDTGDFVIVTNASKIRVTGKKVTDKIYQSHSGYPGGFKEETFASLISRAPEKVITLAVAGMLPKGKLGRAMIKKLKVYADDKHEHAANKPVELKLN